MRMPSVSVIIPVYNSAHTLPAAIDSVLAQSLPPSEILVIDNNSTDDVGGALAPYGDRVRLLHEPQAGEAHARNRGIAESLGELIAWLDADDTWMPHKLELQVPLFADPAVGLVYCDFRTHFADGSIRESFLQGHPRAAVGDVLEQYAQSRFFLPSMVIQRRSTLEPALRFDPRQTISTDVELFARVCLRWMVARAEEVLVDRYEGAGNLTGNNERTGLFTIMALESVMRRESGLTPTQRQACLQELGRQHFWRAYEYFLAGRFAPAREHLRAAVDADPTRRDGAAKLLRWMRLPPRVVRVLRSVQSRLG